MDSTVSAAGESAWTRGPAGLFLTPTLSDIRRMTVECERLGGLNLGQGTCALPVQPSVNQAAIRAIERGESTYAPAQGIAPLREAIAGKLLRDNGLVANPDTEIVVTSGATGGYVSALHALLDPGDGVLFPEPFYGYHVQAARVARLVPQFVPLVPPDFVLSEEALRQALTPSTRAIVLCTPGNPSGRMFRAAELDAVARVAEAHGLLVISDEVYEYVRFDGRRHLSPASREALARRTITIMSMSKTYNVTGWRLGYVVAPPSLAALIRQVSDLYFVCAPTPLQHAAVEALGLPPSAYEELQSVYQSKRDRLCRTLSAAGLRPCVPEGAFYVLADIGRMGFSGSREAAMALLERVGVASVPGTSFFDGALAQRFVRFCFAVPDNVLDAACERLTTLDHELV